MIEVKNLTKKFILTKKQKKEMGNIKKKHILAVDNISFKCSPGKIFTLLGPNGAGKTTTLRIIATLLKPTSGKVSVSGLDVAKEPHIVRKKIGFLTGTTQLYARLTPLEMIKYYSDLYGLDKKVFEKRKKALFKKLGIDEFSERRIGKLSSGMKQKVSIVRALINDPEVVVFDESTVGLDVVSAKNIINIIRDCRDEGKTVLFSTHIMGEVNLLSDDLAIIDKGELIYNGSFNNFKNQMQTKTLEDEFIRTIEEG